MPSTTLPLWRRKSSGVIRANSCRFYSSGDVMCGDTDQEVQEVQEYKSVGGQLTGGEQLLQY